MTTNPDLIAGSDVLTHRLIDLARAAHWAGQMKDEQRYLNDVLNRALDGFGEFEELMPIDEAVARLRESAVIDYMNGIDEDEHPAVVSAEMERVNDAVRCLETIAIRADRLRSYAEYALNLIEPPVHAGGEDEPGRCPECMGEGGRHNMLHERHETGGGGVNRPCSRAAAEGEAE
ncbi:hypothetical protein [Glycomyces arizonensis]|uniref:hypothetical protein n=1 Tax=Glycomyces arizonensis TaxID=256035 RepID=UPI000423169B|nr:hypothetical protein [Glycomyces arizonensis]